MRKVYLPGTPNELWRLLNEEPDAVLFAGGTDLFTKMRAGEANPFPLIGLERIEKWRGVREESSALWLGACTTFAELLRSELVRNRLPLLAKAIATIGSPPIRNMGTLGGNICTASPAGDSLPALYVMNAEIELLSSRESRLVPIRDFIAGPGRTQLRKGEVLTGVRVGFPREFQVQHFEKIGLRNALACSVASMAALLKMSGDGRVEEARIAWGSVGPTVVVSSEVEAFLRGKKHSQQTAEEAAVMAERAAAPIDDVRGSAEYRRCAAGNLLRRLLQSTYRGETLSVGAYVGIKIIGDKRDMMG